VVGEQGLGVAFDGFAASLPGLVALVLFGTWIITMVVLMWRRSSPWPPPPAPFAAFVPAVSTRLLAE
jgi:hypothetical protein